MISRKLFSEVLPWIERFEVDIGIRSSLTEGLPPSAEQRVPHTQLRLALQGDPSMDALLPGVSGCVSLGDGSCAPFRVLESGLILVPPALLTSAAATAVAARWGSEALHAANSQKLDHRRIVALLRHGAGLLDLAEPSARDLVLSILPSEIAAELWEGKAVRPSRRLCQWQAGLIDGQNRLEISDEAFPASELETPMEQLLVAGGDSRLLVDRETQLNKYGVCPRPRPDAVHFSSSTASAITDHGFWYCDLLRRALLDAELALPSTTDLRRCIAAATIAEIERLLALEPSEADMVLTPSGTDTELVAVMLALAGAGERGLTNLLVAPDECGRGVRLAGAGKFFDGAAATGVRIEKGAAAFGDRRIELREAAIRDAKCRVRPAAEVDSEWLAEGRAALHRGQHVLVHVLQGSKTGLSGPSLEAVERLVSERPDRVDVVVDACQMRSVWPDLGDMVRKGWMVQISGSKFLTGPPFSGALLLPPSLRARVAELDALLAVAPGVGCPEDWSSWWAERLRPSASSSSFGPIFRWIPALMEGHLYRSLGEAARLRSFERFRTALISCFLGSPFLEAIGDEVSGSSEADIARLSIISFRVLGKCWDGSLKPLDEAGCLWLFEHLNKDMSRLVSDLTPAEKATARLPCHIGQPVILKANGEKVAFLRLVLGARFFNIVGYAEEEASEAALESEIADARRVLAKIEWIASRWWKFHPLATSGGAS